MKLDREKQLKKENKTVTFFKYANEFLDDLERQGKYNVAITDRSRMDIFQAFLKGQDPFFQDITLNTLEKFKVYLIEKEYSQRTFVNYMIRIRALFIERLKARSKILSFWKQQV